MEYVGLLSTGITSSCSCLPTALHKIKSIEFTPPDNCDDISDSLATSTVLEKLGSDLANQTMIRGINRNNSIKELRFHQHGRDFQAILNLAEVNKTIIDVNIASKAATAYY